MLIYFIIDRPCPVQPSELVLPELFSPLQSSSVQVFFLKKLREQCARLTRLNWSPVRRNTNSRTCSDSSSIYVATTRHDGDRWTHVSALVERQPLARCGRTYGVCAGIFNGHMVLKYKVSSTQASYHSCTRTCRRPRHPAHQQPVPN